MNNRRGLRSIFERLTFWIYMMSAMCTINLLFLSIIFIGSNIQVSSFTFFTWGIIFGIIFLNLRYVGYKHLHFREHENIMDSDVLLDFETQEEVDKWIKMNEILDELNTKDFQSLSSINKRVIKQALEEMIDADDPTKNE